MPFRERGCQSSMIGAASHRRGNRVQYIEAIVVLAVAAGLGWAADLMTGRRNVGVSILVAVTGAACGAFLAVRVFATASFESWGWAPWSVAGAILALFGFFLFRNKR